MVSAFFIFLSVFTHKTTRQFYWCIHWECFGGCTCECQSWQKATSHVWYLVHSEWQKSHPSHGIPHFSSTISKLTKGHKAVLTEHGLYESNLHGKCAKKCVLETCCNKYILESQPDFWAQKSLMQETIEAGSHLCLILPKFHCKLNFIEFFLGAVKYLHDNCDYTFDTLKENMPMASESVGLHTIWCWEHHMFCWMEAYFSGWGTTETPQQVEKFNATTYWSHRCLPIVHDWLAHLFPHTSNQYKHFQKLSYA